MFIPGSNNGQAGFGMCGGALFPSDMGNTFGNKGIPLPIDIQFPTAVVAKPYSRAFGNVYQLTPGGVTTAEGWGFKDKSFGRRKSKRNSRKRKKSKQKRTTHRCKGINKDGKQCKHRTTEVYCQHHQ